MTPTPTSRGVANAALFAFVLLLSMLGFLALFGGCA